MKLKPCPNCTNGVLIYDPTKVGNKCSSCNYFESLKVERSHDEVAEIQRIKIEFLEKYNEYKRYNS